MNAKKIIDHIKDISTSEGRPFDRVFEEYVEDLRKLAGLSKEEA